MYIIPDFILFIKIYIQLHNRVLYINDLPPALIHVDGLEIFSHELSLFLCSSCMAFRCVDILCVFDYTDVL